MLTKYGTIQQMTQPIIVLIGYGNEEGEDDE